MSRHLISAPCGRQTPLCTATTCLTFSLLQNGSQGPHINIVPFHSSIVCFLAQSWCYFCVGQHSPAGCTLRTLSAASGCPLACFLIMKPHFISVNARKNWPVTGSHESPAQISDFRTAGTAGTFTLRHLTSQQTSFPFKFVQNLSLLCWMQFYFPNTELWVLCIITIVLCLCK